VTVYVDNMLMPYKPKHRPGVTYLMSHMIADTDDELHAMARKINVSRRWYQGDHYDVCKSARELAIELGARQITRIQLSAMAMLRRWGEPMGEPETAKERLRACIASKQAETALS
jgi:Protein of unknown function (DUF4031)